MIFSLGLSAVIQDADCNLTLLQKMSFSLRGLHVSWCSIERRVASYVQKQMEHPSVVFKLWEALQSS